MNDDLRTLIATVSKIDILESRFERHLTEIKEEHKKIVDRSNQLTDIISDLRLAIAEKEKATIMTVFKMILINGGIGSLAGALAGLVTSLAH